MKVFTAPNTNLVTSSPKHTKVSIDQTKLRSLADKFVAASKQHDGINNRKIALTAAKFAKYARTLTGIHHDTIITATMLARKGYGWSVCPGLATFIGYTDTQIMELGGALLSVTEGKNTKQFFSRKLQSLSTAA